MKKNEWKKKGRKLFSCAIVVSILAGSMGVPAQAAGEMGWQEENGVKYWYEDGVKQGLEGRGKEIYDPDSDAWYWLDSVQDGAMAVNKDVYQESEAGECGDFVNEEGKRCGKWVRYDENGHMVKGWDTNENGTYYFDLIYGTMMKGTVTIDGQQYTFNQYTGILENTPAPVQNGWVTVDGADYWYENGVKQGTEGRGKEIYDPASDAWYWLDAPDGKKAVSKDVYQESEAGDWGDFVNEEGRRCGKWVRYDENGHMIKGWSENESGKYYFDPIYGTMAKGVAIIGGTTYRFDAVTGICLGEENKELFWRMNKTINRLDDGTVDEWTLYEYKREENAEKETETTYKGEGTSVISNQCEYTYINEKLVKAVEKWYEEKDDGTYYLYSDSTTSYENEVRALQTILYYDEDETITNRLEYRYNADGKILLSINYNEDGSSYRYIYEYNENGKKTKTIYERSDSSKKIYTYEYDGNGYLVKETVEDGTGKVISYTLYTNDADGNVLEDIGYGTWSNWNEQTNSYDETWKPSRRRAYAYNENGKEISCKTYLYNSEGEEYLNSSNSIGYQVISGVSYISSRDYEYRKTGYDENGNFYAWMGYSYGYEYERNAEGKILKYTSYDSDSEGKKIKSSYVIYNRDYVLPEATAENQTVSYTLYENFNGEDKRTSYTEAEFIAFQRVE